MKEPTTNAMQKETNPNGVGKDKVVQAIAAEAAPAAVAVASTTASTAGHPEPAGHAKVVSIDRYAEKSLARKKKMKSAHRRRLKASYAKG